MRIKQVLPVEAGYRAVFAGEDDLDVIPVAAFALVNFGRRAQDIAPLVNRGYSLAPAPMYARYLGLLGPDETLQEPEMEFLERAAMIEEDES